MIVLKFGGTSVGSREMIDRALDIAGSYLDRAPVLVASAMSKTTDRLVQITSIASSGDERGALAILDQISTAHLETAEGFLTGERLEKTRSLLGRYIGELSSLIKGLALLHECTPRSSDAILSFGELMSTCIIASRAQERGMAAHLLDSRDFVRTNDQFTNAAPDMAETTRLVRASVHPRPGLLLVMQGFIARAASGATTTLGRGGSDFSA
ncbi:MAG TPA: lysine-sensitive aspartokinase 3, partial [Spirochaetia bacterium]|nr:lysine-sensitive aspartokinase 3 [Spirochaetia bacterium]